VIEKVSWGIAKYKADPQKAYEEIKSHGEFTPENVLDVARNPQSVIHDDFEWRDDVAGEKFRLIQARRMIQCFVVVRDNPRTKEKETYRALEISSKPKTYKPRQFFVEEADEYKLLLTRATNELKSIRNRYSKIAELETVFEAIDEI